MKLTKFVKANKFILVATVLSVFTLVAGYSSLNQPPKVSLAQSPSGGTPINFDAPTIIVPSVGGAEVASTLPSSAVSSAVLVANEVPTSVAVSVASAVSMPTVSAPSTPDIGALINTSAVSVEGMANVGISSVSSSAVSSVSPAINATKIVKNNTPRSGGSDWVVWIGALFILATGIYLQYRSKTMHKLATDEKTIN